MPKINMSCGQTFLSPTCLKRMNQQVEEPIYYPKYYESEISTVKMLKKVYETNNTVLITTGTGTYGIEMGLRSVFEKGEKVAVVNCGIFGAVAVRILSISGIEPVPVSFDFGAPVDVNRVYDVLKNDHAIKGLYAVHDETTTGVMAPLEELGRVCKELDVLFIVDAISSIAGVPLKTDCWNIDLCIANPQKCMNGPQGIVMLACSPNVYEKINNRQTEIDTLSLDLMTWTRYHEVKVHGYLDWWKNRGESPLFEFRAPHEVSPPATLVWGLQGALEDILAEGLDKRFARHKTAGLAVRQGVKALGLSIIAQEEVASDVVTVISLPNGINERDFREYLLYKHNVAIGNGEISNSTVRIGTMGISANEKYILPVIHSVGDALNNFGVKTDIAKGIAAASSVFLLTE